MAARQWKGDTYGNGWMHRNLIRILRYTDVRILYLFSDIFVVPFCILFNRSRKTAWSFYRKRLHRPFLQSCWLVYRNHCLFSQVVIDRFAMYAGKSFDVALDSRDWFGELAAREEGFVQLSAHIGNYEMAGYSLKSDRKIIHPIVYSFEKESVMKGRNSLFQFTNVQMITLKEDMSHLFEIDEALCRGDIVSFPTDRHMDGGRCLTLPFLGADAKFPQGPFSVATMRGADTLAVNVMKTGLKQYRIYLTPLLYDKEASRKEQMAQLSAAYVAELEKMVRMYPTQWFNFYDFWA